MLEMDFWPCTKGSVWCDAYLYCYNFSFSSAMYNGRRFLQSKSLEAEISLKRDKS